MAEPITIATWPFGKTAVEAAMKVLARGEPALDAALAGAQAVEDDTSIRNSVGFGSLPDRLGRLTLDACVMDGRTLACGSVACVEHIRHPAALARRVMEKTPHVMLVGDGAKWFALQQGFPLEVPYTADSIKEWLDAHPDLKKKEKAGKSPVRADGAADITINEFNHDTVTVLSLDKKGHLGGVCTTSGLGYKLPGRVGDSPIIGAGLYVDDLAGAAGGTGVGEEIIRIGGSLFIAEQMRAGKTPQEACELACKRANAAAGRRGVHPARVAFLALDPKGNVGAACTEKTDFKYAVGRGDKVELLTAKEIGPTA
ncbi:N(4)-(Beta-N-acetylglucosaminyl)-L-asparaginase precursor [Gemmata sp. SH-PL17]|uniref:N(4)-(beta-N-acetylglucosaminyl)-L-asparaginase n=1 Tax=Gemmata sp. SH-PL17 TaxID=1630693 RepID=UPI0004B32CDC|nr:N(4)-(beta-N-acetylglucosaminyl)-L-asparaginase [Gemmata sp. SH-PL17]AMV29511.1 N(4)-(Beta-N-acetylglucosaminyl)-L-asparaginase precursor [Gemmata sp. SH-PL17]